MIFDVCLCDKVVNLLFEDFKIKSRFYRFLSRVRIIF